MNFLKNIFYQHAYWKQLYIQFEKCYYHAIPTKKELEDSNRKYDQTAYGPTLQSLFLISWQH